MLTLRVEENRDRRVVWPTVRTTIDDMMLTVLPRQSTVICIGVMIRQAASCLMI